MIKISAENVKISIEGPSISTIKRLYLSIFLCLFLVLIQGVCIRWSSLASEKLNDIDDNPLSRPISTDESQILDFSRILGIFLGAVICAKLSRRIGRKSSILLLSLLILIFFFLNAFGKSFWSIAAAKLCEGVIYSGTVILIPIYICELSQPKSRGKFCCSITLFQNIGVLVTNYEIATYVPNFLYYMGLIIFFILFSHYGIESPYYNLYLGKYYTETKELLKYIRGSTEIEKISDSFKTKEKRRALIIGFGLTIFMNLSGGTVILSYAPFIFDSAYNTWLPQISTIILSTVQVIFSFMAIGITHRLGRKLHLAISYIILSISLIFVAFYFSLQDQEIDMSSFTWLLLIGLSGSILAFCLGVQPLLPAVLGEIFPFKIKSAAIGFSLTCGATINFLLNYFFESVQSEIGLGSTFWIFTFFGIFATIFISKFMIETHGETLEEIQETLNVKFKRHEGMMYYKL